MVQEHCAVALPRRFRQAEVESLLRHTGTNEGMQQAGCAVQAPVGARQELIDTHILPFHRLELVVELPGVNALKLHPFCPIGILPVQLVPNQRIDNG